MVKIGVVYNLAPKFETCEGGAEPKLWAIMLGALNLQASLNYLLKPFPHHLQSNCQSHDMKFTGHSAPR